MKKLALFLIFYGFSSCAFAGSSVYGIQAPSLSRADYAALNLELIRDEIKRMKGVNAFSSFFDSEAKLKMTLHDDLNLFLDNYHDLPLAAEALYLRGMVEIKQDHAEQAAVSWLQVMFEFPKTDADVQAREVLPHLLENDWTDFKMDIYTLMNQVPNKDTPTRLAALINGLYPIEDSKLLVALSQLQLNFLKRFPNNKNADEVQVLMGHNLGYDSPRSGIFGFKKLLALYPNSAYRPEAMLGIADLQRRMKEYKDAEDGYYALIQEYPNHELTKTAYQNLALTQDKNLRNYDQAIETYQTIIKKYGGSELAAVSYLSAMRIADKKVKKHELAFNLRQQFLIDFPKSPDAPKILYDMAEYQRKISNVDKANQYYKQLIRDYPKSKFAQKAEKRLSGK